MNPEALRQQNQTLIRTVNELKAKLDTNTQHNSLLVEIAQALREAHEASAPSYSTADNNTRTKPGPRPPAKTHPGARAAANRLRRKLEEALQTWSHDKESNFERRRPPTEQVRCRNTKCDRLDQRIAKQIWVGRSRIDFTHCPTCGGPLTPADR